MTPHNPNSVLFGILDQILVRGTKGWFDGNPDSSSRDAGWQDGAYPLNAIRSVTSNDQNVWWRSEGKNGHWGEGYTSGSKLVFDAGSGESTTGMDFWYYNNNSGNPLPESYLGTGRLYLSDPESLPDKGKDFDTFMVDDFVVSGIQPDKDDKRNVYYFEKLVTWGSKLMPHWKPTAPTIISLTTASIQTADLALMDASSPQPSNAVANLPNLLLMFRSKTPPASSSKHALLSLILAKHQKTSNSMQATSLKSQT